MLEKLQILNLFNEGFAHSAVQKDDGGSGGCAGDEERVATAQELAVQARASGV